MAHAANSPSVIPRRVRCLASGRIEAGIPGDGGSKAADEGTAVHAVIEKCLLEPFFDPATLIGEPWLTESKWKSIYTAQNIADAKKHLAYVGRRAEELGDGEIHPESKVDPAMFTGRADTAGTADTIIVGEAAE